MKPRSLWWGMLGLMIAAAVVDHYATRRQLEELRGKYGEMAAAETSRSAAQGDAVRAQLALLSQAATVVAPTTVVAGLPPPSQLTSESQLGTKPLDPPSYAEHAAHIDMILSREAKDSGWSQESESKIATALAPLAVGGAHVDQVTCRATLCRMRVEDTTDGALRDFVDEIFATRDKSRYWKGDMFTVRDPESPPGTFANVVYFARENHPIPFLEN